MPLDWQEKVTMFFVYYSECCHSKQRWWPIPPHWVGRTRADLCAAGWTVRGPHDNKEE